MLFLESVSNSSGTSLSVNNIHIILTMRLVKKRDHLLKFAMFAVAKVNTNHDNSSFTKFTHHSVSHVCNLQTGLKLFIRLFLTVH